MSHDLRRALARLAACQTQLEKATAEIDLALVNGDDGLLRITHSELLKVQGRLQVIAEHLIAAQHGAQAAKEVRRRRDVIP